MHKTADEIAESADHLDGAANIKAINAAFRAQDESHLWPINGRFNVTERAIRQVRRLANANGASYGIEYAYMIDGLISDIVNSQV